MEKYSHTLSVSGLLFHEFNFSMNDDGQSPSFKSNHTEMKMAELLPMSISIFPIINCILKINTVKILKFGTPQTIAIIVLKIEKLAVTLH